MKKNATPNKKKGESTIPKWCKLYIMVSFFGIIVLGVFLLINMQRDLEKYIEISRKLQDSEEKYISLQEEYEDFLIKYKNFLEEENRK